MTDHTPRHFLLSMQFDGDQVSNVLLYQFTLNGNDAVTKEGRYTGVIQFNKGDTIDLEVTMTATENESKVSSVQVMSLDLVSVPNVTENVESFSPFVANEVTRSLVDNWSEPKLIEQGGFRKWITTWDGDPLEVVAEKGFWQFAGFLGVAVYEKRGLGEEVLDIVRTPRVLSFDPEAGSGGSGGGHN